MSSNVIPVMFELYLQEENVMECDICHVLSCTYKRRRSSNVISVMFELYLQEENVMECDICHVLSCTYKRRRSSNVISVMFELYLQEENVMECDICHVLSCTYKRRTSWNVISAMFWAILTTGERHGMWYLPCFELYLQEENVMECDICHVLSCTYKRRMSSNVISVMFELYLQEENVMECDICHVLSCTYNRRTSWNVISAMFWAILTTGERPRMWYLSCFELYLQEENVMECDICHVLSCTYKRRTSSNVISVMFWAVLTRGERHGMWYLPCFELYLQQENVIECDICHVLSYTYNRRTSSNVISVMFWAVLTRGERHGMWYLPCFELYLQQENVIECDICHVLSYTYNRRTSSNVISVMFWAVLTRGERHGMWYLPCFELYLQQENVIECDICHVLSCTYKRRTSWNVISAMFWAILTRGERHGMWYLSCFELYLQQENVIECDICHVLSCTWGPCK